jgi:2-keto-4-pentenoate hydratase/2-oxohepta-3-ene-1,7-dioic acid hydratase in catechol pathway
MATASEEAIMKICQYGAERAGIVEGERVYPLGDALVKAKVVHERYTMLDIVTALAEQPAAMDIARDTAKLGAALPLASVQLLPPITNPPAIWAAAANYRAHQTEMMARVGSRERTQLSKDDLMADRITLRPGDLVSTGTPAGVSRLSDGDRLRGGIEGIGEMAFTVRAET